MILRQVGGRQITVTIRLSSVGRAESLGLTRKLTAAAFGSALLSGPTGLLTYGTRQPDEARSASRRQPDRHDPVL